jgi:hypothetical protein
MTLWPVYLWAAMQEDAPMLFEVGDVVTWPVGLIDAGARDSGWPTGVPVRTMVALQPGPNPKRGRWAVTPAFSAYWRGEEPVGSEFEIGAGLLADFFHPPISYITGAVRRIEIASSRTRCPKDEDLAAGSPNGAWDLREVRVAPLTFDHNRGGEPGGCDEHGVLVHLEVIRPRCRCQEIKQISGDQAAAYARRHLHETDGDWVNLIVDYICPVTGFTWRLDHPRIASGWRPARLVRLGDDSPPMPPTRG